MRLFPLLLVILGAITQGHTVDGLVIINKTLNLTNDLPTDLSLKTTIIKDNILGETEGTLPPTVVNRTYVGTTASAKHSTLLEGLKDQNHQNLSSGAVPKKTPLPTKRPTSAVHGNSTTVPSPHPSRHNAHKILLYILIPASCVIFLGIVYCLIRHAQRVQRKRRLERELLHQYSYPNSEAGDVIDDQRILEVESVINTQFSAIDHDDKDFINDIPQVAVAIGEGPKLAVQDSPSTPGDMEASTSFNC